MYSEHSKAMCARYLNGVHLHSSQVLFDDLKLGLYNLCHGKVPKLFKGMLDFMEDLSKGVDSH